MQEENKINILLLQAMEKAGIQLPTVERMTEEEYTKMKCNAYNSGEGTLDKNDGYNCEECKNKGYVSYPSYNDTFGYWSETQKECTCMTIRRTIKRLERSGLKNIIKDYTFKNYIVNEPWQQAIKDMAVNYCKNPNNSWFFIGGQPGAGKTHLCTAIAGHYLKQGQNVKYMIWRDEIVKIKRVINDSDYEDIINEYKNASVLYIDDLFKPSKDSNNNIQKPTAADVQVAFEILNYRYNNKSLITIISSERDVNELIEIDEATASRIVEMSFQNGTGLNIAKDVKKNHRLKGITTL